MKFSQRLGYTPAKKEIQIEFIDEELKNRLWNSIYLILHDHLQPKGRSVLLDIFGYRLWNDFYKLPIDHMPETPSSLIRYIREKFFDAEWFEIYDFIEYILNSNLHMYFPKDKFINHLNKILEKEFSGYRIIDNKVVPITNKIEFDEIEDAIENTYKFTGIQGANIHLKKSLEFLSDKKNPDYRNSIKESISAVEATARKITGELTLGKALKKLEKKGLEINPQLKAGLEKIYAYTNNQKSGIRHAFSDQPNEPDYFDAKYMLVSCSSFINYLIGKARKIDLEL